MDSINLLMSRFARRRSRQLSLSHPLRTAINTIKRCLRRFAPEPKQEARQQICPNHALLLA